MATALFEVFHLQAALATLGLALLTLGCVAVRRDARHRLAMQRALAAANADLALEVQSRSAELGASELRFRRLVELSADGIVLCDSERSVVYANRAALSLLGYADLAQLAGRRADGLFRHAGAVLDWEWLRPLWISPRELAFRDAGIIDAAGDEIAVGIGAVSYLEQGQLWAQLVLHDRTRLRGTEVAMREQLGFIDQLLEAIATPLSVRDERGRYVRVNRAYERVHGCRRADLLRQSVYDAMPYEHADWVSRHDQAAMRGPGPVLYEHRLLLRPDEPARRFLSQACAVRLADDSVIGVITVDTDVTEIGLKETELRRINSELEMLSQQLIKSQETERRRIARDLHDQVGQILTALKMSLQGIAARGGAAAPALAAPIGLVDEALQHVRSLTTSLHPHILEDLGLDAAVRGLVDRFVQPLPREVRLDMRLDPARGGAASELVAFRVVQESLTNVMRHANARCLEISLETRAGSLHLSVADDGEGFEAGGSRFDLNQPQSLGVASMRERVAELGGDFAIESVPGEGTVVRAVVPWGAP